jgi:hypothetical protein
VILNATCLAVVWRGRSVIACGLLNVIFHWVRWIDIGIALVGAAMLAGERRMRGLMVR